MLGGMVETVTDLLGDSAARRAARRFALREFRAARLPAALVTALALSTAGGAVTAEVISGQTGHPLLPRTVAHVSRSVHTTRWDAPRMLAVDVALLGAGLGLVLLAAVPGRTRQEPLRTGDPLLASAVTRAGLCQALSCAVTGVPGILLATVRVRGRLRRRVVVRATIRSRGTGDPARPVRAAVVGRLEEIGLLQSPRVVVRPRWKKD